MITIDDLKNVPLLQGFSDAIYEKLLTIARAQTLQEDETVYEAQEEANDLYIVKFGKIILEADVSDTVTVSLASIKPGYLFGWYGMLPASVQTMRAKATETSDVIVLPGDELRMLMDEDHDFGYQFMNKMYMLMKIRMDRRTNQFLSVLERHPDLNA
ncbi:Crp/Fnr family transcriptional regulator [Desulfocurvus sp. DL9XJH121]